MPYTQEPRGLQVVNNVNTTAVGALTTNLCWFLGSVSLTVVSCILLLRADPTGLTLSGFLLAAWGGKSVAGVVDSNNKRKTNPAYAPVIKAAEEGRVAGAAAAAVIAEKSADLQAARAPTQGTTPTNGAPSVTVNAADQSQVEVSAGATGEVAVPTVKAATEPNAFTDDERDDGDGRN